MTTRWIFTEQATSETWTMPTNPNKMSALPRMKTLATVGSVRQDRPRTMQTPTPAQAIEWGGVLLSEAHHDDLLEWSRKPGIIEVEDHLGRVFEVLISSFLPQPEAGRRPDDPKRKYTMRALFLRRTA